MAKDKNHQLRKWGFPLLALALLACLTLLFQFFSRSAQESDREDDELTGEPSARGTAPRDPTTRPARTRCSTECQQCMEGAPDASDPCCEQCREDERKCRDGRRDYDKSVVSKLAQLSECKEDADCIYASFSDSCRSYCARPLSKFTLGQVIPPLQELGRQHCETCQPMQFDCPGRSTAAVGCRDAQCVVVD